MAVGDAGCLHLAWDCRWDFMNGLEVVGCWKRGVAETMVVGKGYAYELWGMGLDRGL